MQKLFEKWMNGLNRVVISERLLEDSLLEARQRAPILVGMLSISGGSALMMTIGLLVLYSNSSDPLHFTGAGIALLTLFGYLGTLIFFKIKQDWQSAANLYAVTSLFSTVGPVTITGGLFASPYLPLILIVPTFLFLIAGRKYGLYWTVITAGCVSLMYFLEAGGVSYPQVIPDAYMATFRYATWSMTLSLLVLGLISYEVNFETLTERVFAERSQFAHEAMHDPLTGLCNRKLFYVRAEEAIEHAKDKDHKAALIFVDLNDFKLVNDNFGHEVGDDVLSAMADRLRGNVRSTDTVARLGGDEFAVILHGIEQADAAHQMVEKLSASLQKSLRVGDNILRVSGSFGVAIAPDQGVDIDHLLAKADKEMYRAKDSRESIKIAAS